MYKKFAILALFLVPHLSYAACSHANLTRCLDSACAINISTNPAARCQYCGTANAGEPANDGMRSVSAGTSTQYNIPAKELKSAPTDPGKRYIWATEKCLKIVSGCSPDDVSDTYDKLIEQSCTAAGVQTQMAALTSKPTKTKSKSTCSSTISACITSDTKCTPYFDGCASDADFDKFFAACAVDATGCDDHLASIRSELLSSRDSTLKNAEANLQSIVKSYTDARERRISDAKSMCIDNAGRDACIERMCGERMANGCGVGFDDERAMATNLCKYYETACATLK